MPPAAAPAGDRLRAPPVHDRRLAPAAHAAAVDGRSPSPRPAGSSGSSTPRRARGRIARGLPIHYTEFGFQTDPPDGLFGVPLARQAEYLNESDWIAYRNPRVRSVAQYELVDDPASARFQSGLRFADGRPKPAYDAYRLPLWITRKGASHLRVYGQVRPLANGGVTQVELQNAPLGLAVWRTVATVAVRSPRGHLLRTVPRREGRWRLRWVPAPGAVPLFSREAVAAAR